MVNTRVLKAQDPVHFYHNWKMLDPKGYAKIRIIVSYEDTCAIIKRFEQGKVEKAEMLHCKKKHIALVKRLSEENDLSKSDVRAYYIK